MEIDICDAPPPDQTLGDIRRGTPFKLKDLVSYANEIWIKTDESPCDELCYAVSLHDGCLETFAHDTPVVAVNAKVVLSP